MTREVDQSSLFEFARTRAAGGHPLTLPELVDLFAPVVRTLTEEPGAAFSSPDKTLSPAAFRLSSSANEPCVELAGTGDDFLLEPVSGAGGDADFSWAYAAPEHFRPEQFGSPSAQTDVWGLALTLVELCAAKRVATEDARAAMARLLDPARRPTPAALGVSVTAGVDAVFRRALALPPGERFADVGVFFAELKTALGTGGGARFREFAPNESFEIPDLDVSPGPSRASPSSRTASPSRRSVPSRSSKPPRASASITAPNALGVSSAAGDWDNDLVAAADGRQRPIELDDQWSGAARWEASSAPRPNSAPRPESTVAPETVKPRVPSKPSRSIPERPEPAPAGSERTFAAPSAPPAPSPGWTEKVEGMLDRARSRFESLREDDRWSVRAAPGLALVALSIALTLVDQAYAAIAAARLSFGPVRLSWIAAICLIAGVVWGAAWAQRRPS